MALVARVRFESRADRYKTPRPYPGYQRGRHHRFTASLTIAMEVAGYFELEEAQAREIAAQVAQTTSRWRDEAVEHGIPKGEIDRMASAFEHEDLNKGLGQ